MLGNIGRFNISWVTSLLFWPSNLKYGKSQMFVGDVGRVILLNRLPSGAVLTGFGVDGQSSIIGGGSGGGGGVS